MQIDCYGFEVSSQWFRRKMVSHGWMLQTGMRQIVIGIGGMRGTARYHIACAARPRYHMESSIGSAGMPCTQYVMSSATKLCARYGELR